MVYEIEGPDGEIYDIEGPEGASDAELFAALAEAFPDLAVDYPELTASAAPPPPPPESDTSFAQNLGVITGALAPYATAAGLGAAAGAPFAGVGAIPGAAGGVLSLGLSDLGTGIYNLAAPAFGGQTVPLPSQTIREMYQDVGIGRAPQTAGQRILGQTVEGLAGGVAAPAALATTAGRMAPSTTRSIMQTLAQAPRQQAAAATGAAAAPAIAREAGVTDPLALTGISLAGGMVAGRAATPKSPSAKSPEDLRVQADNAYQEAKSLGVRFDEAAVSNLASKIRQDLTAVDDIQFNPRLHPRIAVALDEIDAVAASGQPISFSQVEMVRRVANTARRSADPDERRLGGIVIEKIDDFITQPPANAVVAGDSAATALAITNARKSWRLMRQGEAIQKLVDDATESASGLTAGSLRSQFRTVIKNKNRMRQFDPEVQKLMKDFVRGKGGVAPLQALGNLAPGTSLRGLIVGGGAASVGYAGNPALAALMAAGGLGARAAANRMAAGQVENIANVARGGAVGRPTSTGQIAAASLPQAVGDVGARGPVVTYDQTGQQAFIDGEPVRGIFADGFGITDSGKTARVR
jgi:hypothetical protein